MLDRYVYGDTDRISPEAPVPVVKVKKTEERPGGAANVAANIKCLGMEVKLLGITGNDAAARALEKELSKLGVSCCFFHRSGVPTITKLRILSQNQQLLRMDYEADFKVTDSASLMKIYADQVHNSSLVVLSDYAKGSLRQVESFINLAGEYDLPVIVDPKGADFSRYKNATVLTPNYKEFEAVVGECLNDAEINEKGLALCDSLSLDALLITRGERGVTFLDKVNNKVISLPAEAHEVFDVTGAGDTVIATFSAAIAAGYASADAVYFANSAAGIAVEKLGAATVAVAELNSASGNSISGDVKRMDLDNLLDAINASRDKGEKIVMTNGCFDILHAGHVEYLRQARALGDKLLVAVNDDESVRKLKGEGRPLQELDKRLRVLSGLASVDWLIAFAEDTPEELTGLIKPDLLVKGGDYDIDGIAGAGHVKSHGGEVRILPYIDDCSTSHIIDKIKSAGAVPPSTRGS